jgi:pimeloyl-ACP methyl ester carboxylesterase
VPELLLEASPLAPGISPVRVHYLDAGAGSTVLILHGGWGYEVYPFDRQIAALRSTRRIVVPDRCGYGRSTDIASLPASFHRLAMQETRAVIDTLELERPIVWGHSDGAIIALLLALESPDAIAAAIVEATHLYRRKPRSRPFFESILADPQTLGDGVVAVLERDHGARWRSVLERHARAWLAIADESRSDTDDFYDGRLGGITIPVLVVHGARDPRSEPGEIDALGQALARREAGSREVEIHVLPDGGHSPHNERATADRVTAIVGAFIDRLSHPAGAAPAVHASPGSPASGDPRGGRRE